MLDYLSNHTYALVVLMNIICCSLALGLVWAMLIQPRRDRSTWFFMLFAGGVAGWALLRIPMVLPALSGDFSRDWLLRLDAMIIGVVGFGAFLFVVTFIRATGMVINSMRMLAPIILVAWLVAVLAEWALVPKVEGGSSLSVVGYIFAVVLIGYMLAAVWIMLNSRDDLTAQLRIPVLLLVLAFGVSIQPLLSSFSVDILLTTICCGWMGLVMLRFQVFRPLNDLSDELRTANRDLRTAVNDLAQANARNDVLSRELLTASSYKDGFLTTMSHKLRTPLNSIVGYSELLESGVYGELSEKQNDRLTKITANGKTLLRLINYMLDLSKIEAGRLELTRTPLAIDKLVKAVEADVMPQLDAKNLAFETRIKLPSINIYADVGRIQQVILQLVHNAITFTDSGKITIETQPIFVEDGVSKDFSLPFIGWLRDGEWLLISVADTGTGIEPEAQAHIFEEFFQAEESGELGGSGLGLALCKRLVELHDGVLWVKSIVGEGAVFHLALPVALTGRRAETGDSARAVHA